MSVEILMVACSKKQIVTGIEESLCGMENMQAKDVSIIYTQLSSIFEML